MADHAIHPNTQAMLQAWKRMSSRTQSNSGGPAADDYPGLLSRLFVLSPKKGGSVPFRIAGEKLPGLLGHDLSQVDFLTLFEGADRSVVCALAEAVASEQSPGLLRVWGETAARARIQLEIAIAPLNGGRSGTPRLLGLYQTLGDESVLCGRPIETHNVTAAVMPERRPAKPSLRLIANNSPEPAQAT